MKWGFLCVSIDLNKIGTSLVVYGLKMQLVKHDIRSLSSVFIPVSPIQKPKYYYDLYIW